MLLSRHHIHYGLRTRFFVFDLQVLHLVDWDCALAVDPFALDHVVLLHLHHLLHALKVVVSHEPKPSRLLCPFIF